MVRLRQRHIESDMYTEVVTKRRTEIDRKIKKPIGNIHIQTCRQIDTNTETELH